MSDEPTVTVPAPARELVAFLFWAVGAAVSEFYLSSDDHSDEADAYDWLEKLGKACGYEEQTNAW